MGICSGSPFGAGYTNYHVIWSRERPNQSQNDIFVPIFVPKYSGARLFVVISAACQSGHFVNVAGGGGTAPRQLPGRPESQTLGDPGN